MCEEHDREKSLESKMAVAVACSDFAELQSNEVDCACFVETLGMPSPASDSVKLPKKGRSLQPPGKPKAKGKHSHRKAPRSHNHQDPSPARAPAAGPRAAPSITRRFPKPSRSHPSPPPPFSPSSQPSQPQRRQAERRQVQPPLFLTHHIRSTDESAEDLRQEQQRLGCSSLQAFARKNICQHSIAQKRCPKGPRCPFIHVDVSRSLGWLAPSGRVRVRLCLKCLESNFSPCNQWPVQGGVPFNQLHSYTSKVSLACGKVHISGSADPGPLVHYPPQAFHPDPQADQLTKELSELWNRHLFTNADHVKRMFILDTLQSALNSVKWSVSLLMPPSYRVASPLRRTHYPILVLFLCSPEYRPTLSLFGSLSVGLSFATSDMDISLSFPLQSLGKRQRRKDRKQATPASKMLRALRFKIPPPLLRSCQMIMHARIPVMELSFQPDDLSSIKNTPPRNVSSHRQPAIDVDVVLTDKDDPTNRQKTRLLHQFFQCDQVPNGCIFPIPRSFVQQCPSLILSFQRAPMLVVFVKLWAKRCGIGDGKHRSFPLALSTYLLLL